MPTYYRVNISRPTNDEQNKLFCRYIEALREQNKVLPTAVYRPFLERAQRLTRDWGRATSQELIYGNYPPGYKFYFWFSERIVAEQFIVDWMEELGINENEYDENVREIFQDHFTKIVEVDDAPRYDIPLSDVKI